MVPASLVDFRMQPKILAEVRIQENGGKVVQMNLISRFVSLSHNNIVI